MDAPLTSRTVLAGLQYKVRLRLLSCILKLRPLLAYEHSLWKATMPSDGQCTGSVCQDHHEKLWFSDGNIVLASDYTETPEEQGKLLFRVHKSVLAMNSPVFRDMFEVVSDGTADGESHNEMYEGVPYAVIPDPAEHLEVLLGMMYGDFW